MAMHRSRSTESRQFLKEFRKSVHDIVRQMSLDCVPKDNLRALKQRLDALERDINTVTLCTADEAKQLRCQLHILMGECNKMIHTMSTGTASYRAPQVHDGCRGRPSYLVTAQQLRFLVECGFTNREIADILHVSPETVKKRLRCYGITRTKGNPVCDIDLDEEIIQIVEGNTAIGPNAVKSRLLGKGICVSRKRVRDAMHRIDPEGCAQRSISANNRLSRRKYCVAAPLSMWHIDGNHKLIRWGIVIHGGVDGYSRMIVFLRASDNNRAETVFNLFQEAVEEYGLPSRVRVDKGGENNTVCTFMVEERGEDRGSAIRGRSIHNQRIERAWLDVWNGCTNVYSDLFAYLESTNELDPDNDTHKWALHYVFLPRINRTLSAFIQQWNGHGLRTEHYLSPKKLFVRGALHNYSGELTAIKDLFDQNSSEADVEDIPNIPIQVEQAPEQEIPAVMTSSAPCPLTDESVRELKDNINPLDNSLDKYGIHLYQNTLEFIHQNAEL